MSQGYPDISSVTLTVGAEATNVVNVAGQAYGADGQVATEAKCFLWYFSSDAAGDAVLGTAHDGGTAIGTNGTLIEWAANLSGLLITEADGSFDLDITDAGAFTAYLVLVNPTNGNRTVSAVITHAA